MTALSMAVFDAVFRLRLADNGPAPNTLTAAEKKAGWILLFDGHSLDGWRGYKKPDATDSRWKVDEDSLSLPPTTARTRTGSATSSRRTRSSSSSCRSTGRSRRAATAASSISSSRIGDSAIGHEYQVIDDERHPDAKVGPHRQTAAFYDVLPGQRSSAQARGRVEHARGSSSADRRSSTG